MMFMAFGTFAKNAFFNVSMFWGPQNRFLPMFSKIQFFSRNWINPGPIYAFKISLGALSMLKGVKSYKGLSKLLAFSNFICMYGMGGSRTRREFRVGPDATSPLPRAGTSIIRSGPPL